MIDASTRGQTRRAVHPTPRRLACLHGVLREHASLGPRPGLVVLLLSAATASCAGGCAVLPAGVRLQIVDRGEIRSYTRAAAETIPSEFQDIAFADKFAQGQFVFADDRETIALAAAHGDTLAVTRKTTINQGHVCGLGASRRSPRAAVVVWTRDGVRLILCDAALNLTLLCRLPMKHPAGATPNGAKMTVSWSPDDVLIAVSQAGGDPQWPMAEGAIVDVERGIAWYIAGYRDLRFTARNRLIASRVGFEERCSIIDVRVGWSGVAVTPIREVARGRYVAASDPEDGVFALWRPPLALMYAYGYVDLFDDRGRQIGALPTAERWLAPVIISSNAENQRRARSRPDGDAPMKRSTGDRP